MGLAVMLVVTTAMLLIESRESLPILTQTQLDEAYRRWQEHGPKRYDLAVTVTGDQPGELKLQVRDGVVVQMTRDDVVPKRKSTWDYWSVPGMFDVIRLDLEICGKAEVEGRPKLVLRALFDPKLGYPARYQRIDLATRNEVSWEVTRLVPR